LLEQRKVELEEQARSYLDVDGNAMPDGREAIAAIDEEYAPVCAELEDIDASRSYLLPKAGDIVVTVAIDANGKAAVSFWFASKKAQKESEGGAAAKPPVAAGAAVTGDYVATRAANAVAKEQQGLSADGTKIVRNMRRAILRALLVENAQRGGAVAQDYLVWSQLRCLVFEGWSDRAPAVGAYPISAPNFEQLGDEALAQPYLKEMKAQAVWADAISVLKAQSFITATNIGGAFIDFQNSAPELKALAAAVVAGTSLRRSMNADGYRLEVHDVLANATARGHPAAIRELWQPTAHFLELLPKAKRHAIVDGMVDSKTFAAWGKKKAGELSELVLKVLNARSPSLMSSAVSKAKEWVHPYLQFGRPNVVDAATDPAVTQEAA
jgi:ParB family chromosome partitioning protein